MMVSKLASDVKTKSPKNVKTEPPKNAYNWKCTNCKDIITGQMCQLKHCENCNFVGTFVRID